MANAAVAEAPACRADAALCCRSPARPTSVKATPPTFGVQIWPADLTNPTTIEPLVALKPRHLRFALGPNWRRRPALASEMTDAELDRAVANGLDSTHTAAEIEVLQRLRTRTGAMLHLVIWEPPPLPGDSGRPTADGRRLRPPDVALAARFHVAVLKVIGERGLPVDAVELSNEPDGNWNIRIAPADYLALVRAVRAEARRRRVRLPKIYGPGGSSIAATRGYLKDAKLARDILESIDVLSTHGWDNPKRRDRFIELEALLDDLRRLHVKPEVAVTEFGLARPIPADTSDRMNVKTRAANNIANTPFFGAINSRDLLRMYAAGVGTVIQWEYRDESWGKASFGLMDDKGRARPLYRMLREIANHLADDKPRAVMPTLSDNVFVAERSDRRVIWGANSSAQSLAVVFDADARLAMNLATDLPVCRDEHGQPGLLIPPWSVLQAPISKR
jgi:hypothetical protein